MNAPKESKERERVSSAAARYRLAELIETVKTTREPVIIQRWGKDAVQLVPLELSDKSGRKVK